MTKKPKDDTVGPWAKEKLDALGQYLGFYTKVLKNQRHWCRGTIFVDAFAGPGSAKVRTKTKSSDDTDQLFGEPESGTDSDDVEFLKGSPRVALDIADPFSQYVFVERDPERAAELHELARTYGPTRRIEIKEGDASDEITALLSSGIDWKSHRAVVFLDPFGMHVPWETTAALAKTGGIEVLINFPMGMAIQRLLARSGDISTGRRAALDTFFGSPDWWEQAYEEGEDLFGPKTLKLRDSGARLLEWYRGRLREAFGHVSTPRLIKNTRGNPLYYLIWSGPNPLGLKGAEHILSRGERVSGNKG